MDEGNVMGNINSTSAHTYLLSLIGSANAWRTADELARELGDGSQESRKHANKALWYCSKMGMIARRLRGGTGEKECMALVIEGSVRKPTNRQTIERVAIATPKDGPVPLRVEAVPAPVLPEPSPAAREAVERLVRSPTPALTLADVLAKHGRDRNAVMMEQAQADAVVATALESPSAVETGPLEDSCGPIASEPPALDIKAECAAIAERCAADDDAGDPWDVGSDVSPALAEELRSFGGLIERGKREQTIILHRDTKLSVLRHLADLAPPLTAYYLLEIAADLDRVGA